MKMDETSSFFSFAVYLLWLALKAVPFLMYSSAPQCLMQECQQIAIFKLQETPWGTQSLLSSFFPIMRAHNVSRETNDLILNKHLYISVLIKQLQTENRISSMQIKSGPIVRFVRTKRWLHINIIILSLQASWFSSNRRAAISCSITAYSTETV